MVAHAKSRSWLADCAINIRETNNCSGVNHLYSVAALTDNNGAVVERYRYDAYGQRTVLAADGTTVRAASLYGNQIGFTGRYLDAETNLYYFRARYYSGSLGRFIGRDTVDRNVVQPAERDEILGALTSLPLYLYTQQNYRAIIEKEENTQKRGYRDGFNFYMAYYVPNMLDPTGMLCRCVYPPAPAATPKPATLCDALAAKAGATETTYTPGFGSCRLSTPPVTFVDKCIDKACSLVPCKRGIKWICGKTFFGKFDWLFDGRTDSCL